MFSTVLHELTQNEFFLNQTFAFAAYLPALLAFSFLLYFTGLLGIVFNYNNFLITMMSIEMMYLGAVSSFVLYGALCNDPRASVYGLVLLVLAACESAVGLGILIVLHRFEHSIAFNDYQQLGG